MAIKAKLVVRLFADNLVIAESTDEHLWQNTLAIITTGQVPAGGRAPTDTSVSKPAVQARSSSSGANTQIAKMAQEIGVSTDALVGACSPTTEPPFLTLDHRTWEAFKKNTPARGPSSISPIGLAGTLLALWAKTGAISSSTISQAQAVLATVGLRDANPSRGIRNSGWLQVRNGSIILNPAQTTRALEVAKAYSTRTPIEGNSS